MVHISHETPEQTQQRLREVISRADMLWHEGAYTFVEYAVDEFPAHESSRCLAMVRDAQVWSVLKNGGPQMLEQFAVFSFHFPQGLDNSGFVGWLASILKRELGTGVFVVCGQNSKRGGVFDYWGVPIEMREEAAALIDSLRRG